MKYPTLTLWQPYATLLAIGAKHCETRGWAPPARLIGKQLAIHASKRLEFPAEFDTERQMELVTKILATGWAKHLPFGAVVCIATLTGAYRSQGHAPGQEYVSFGRLPELVAGSPPLGGIHMGYPGILFGDHSKGRWLWMLRVDEVLDPPVPAIGRQGIWRWQREERRAA